MHGVRVLCLNPIASSFADMETLSAKMVLGATGGTGAAIFCHPFDVIRVMMQVQVEKRSTLAIGRDIFRDGGVRRGLYAGLSAAFLRQWTYGACRIGIYSFCLKSQAKPAEVSFGLKLLFGLTSGGVGSFVGTPAELALVRMSADAKLPLAKRRGLGVHRVLGSVLQEEGVVGMWRGVGPTVARAMALSSVTLAMTSECKERFPKMMPSLAAYPSATMLLSTTVASFWGTVASQPFDVVKSQMQNMKRQPGAAQRYSGALDCAVEMLKHNPMSLMKGFTPAFAKLTPYTVLSLSIVETLTRWLSGKGAL